MLDTLATPTSLRPQFDEPHLFEMYFLHHGNIPRMLDTIVLLSPEQRTEYPARPTLYEYEKKFGWKAKYKKMHDAVISKLESGVALHYERINQLANLAAAGLAKRLVDALQSTNSEGMRVFSGDLLKIMWEMQRTERGLPTTVSKNSHTFSAEEEADGILRASGLGKVADAIDAAPPDTILAIMAKLGGDIAETPAILQ